MVPVIWDGRRETEQNRTNALPAAVYLCSWAMSGAKVSTVRFPGPWSVRGYRGVTPAPRALCPKSDRIDFYQCDEGACVANFDTGGVTRLIEREAGPTLEFLI